MKESTNSRKIEVPNLSASLWGVPVASGLIFLLALGISIAFVFSFPLPSISDDAREYFALALNISKGAGFSYDGVSPAVYRPPVFSALLGGWFKLTGTSSHVSAGVFQSIIHALGVVASFLLFLEFRSRFWWAFGGALFLAVNPLLVTRMAMVLQEPTVLLFTTLAVLMSVRVINVRSRTRAALAGLSWGICVLSKISSWFGPFLLIAMNLFPMRVCWSRKVNQGAMILLCFMIVMVPWAFRNYIHFDRFIPVNAQSTGMLEWNIQQSNVPGQPPGKEIVDRIRNMHAAKAERQDAMWQYVFDHLDFFLFERMVRNAVHFAAPSRDWWILSGSIEIGSRGVIYWILVFVFHLPLYILLMFRIWQLVIGELGAGRQFVVLFYIAYWAEHVLIWGDPRFGLAVYPLLVSMALPTRPVDDANGESTAG